jgi:hypothetical protein
MILKIPLQLTSENRILEYYDKCKQNLAFKSIEFLSNPP